MKKDWKYILYVSLAFFIFVTVKMMAPKQFDWTVTFAHDDKDPYGGYCLYRLLPSTASSLKHTYKTLYELRDSLGAQTNLLLVASKFVPGDADADVLLNHIANGGKALISAHSFSGAFADTLKLDVTDKIFDNRLFSQNDSSYLQFTNLSLDTEQAFWYRASSINNYFTNVDSLRTTIVARNEDGEPVTIKVNWGKGYLILNTTPLAFTNIYMLDAANHEFISNTLAYVPGELYWTEYYHLGKQEVKSPLRFILSQESLSWAYYLTICSILLFMVFEAKRRQRIIPVITPLKNTTLEFVATIGNLYYQTANHKNIAEKKIQFLFEQIRSQYRLDTNHIDDEFLQTLSLRSGKNFSDIRALFDLIGSIQGSEKITGDKLLQLNSAIEDFYNN